MEVAIILYFKYHSSFLWELTRDAPSKPSLETVEQWVKELSKHCGVVLTCSPRVYATIVNRANYLRLKSLKVIIHWQFSGSRRVMMV